MKPSSRTRQPVFGKIMEREGEEEEEEEDGFCFHEVSFVDQYGGLRTSRVPVVQELGRQGITRLPKRLEEIIAARVQSVSIAQSAS